jgi:glyoxylase-like metal-dependent hydrolase (beta-lactamase superfamily II)
MTDRAYEALEDGLSGQALAVADVERNLITHPPIGYFGIARRVKEKSGADLLAHRDAVDRVARLDEFLGRERAFFRPDLSRMGVPEKTVDTVVAPDRYGDYREPPRPTAPSPTV